MTSPEENNLNVLPETSVTQELSSGGSLPTPQEDGLNNLGSDGKPFSEELKQILESKNPQSPMIFAIAAIAIISLVSALVYYFYTKWKKKGKEKDGRK
jgi:hypothetical protein